MTNEIPDFKKENKRETDRLRRLLQGMDAKAWALEAGHGWKVGTLVCHLAFWDLTTIERLQAWLKSGRLAAMPDHDTVDAINNSVRLLSAGVTAADGCRQAIHSAEEIDKLVAALSSKQLQELASSGRERWFRRHMHRELHLPRLEQVLSLKANYEHP